ncbi:helix-turn-helix transcriptional regulator [Pilimelia columellifera]|uniref:WYL domain-containing protein n=1 Tax=Pilimelia columellifera subsp. columellifera TaxID=706583 RepID=A0ABN3NLW1_9ACTN
MSAPRGGPSAERLARLLNLVPYLLARPGIAIEQAAADLGVTEKQLREDLELLWVCGLPGYGPGDLIDMVLDSDRVTITYDAGIDRPLRLTPDEALALVVALRLLAETPGVGDRGAIERALAKIESAAGELAGAPVAVSAGAPDERAARAHEALRSGRAIQMTYYTASRDATTRRIVDPVRVFAVAGHTYLEAWCRQAQALRLFRADRIDELVRLSEPAQPPPTPAAPIEGAFRPSSQLPLVTLRVGRGARWITEYYPCEQVVESAGDWQVSLRVSDLPWARRLVLGLGPQVTVTSPTELVELVRDGAREALAGYATP